MSKTATLESLNFEAALSELEGIVRGLESGKSPLEESITAYERGMALKNHCEAKLQEAQMKVEKIAVAKDGKISLTPFAEMDDKSV